MVLSFTVTDNKGKYVNGLKPSDFRIHGRRDQREALDVLRRQPAGHADSGRRHDEAAAAGRAAEAQQPSGYRGTRPAAMRSWARTYSFCSTPATSCITGSSTRKTRSPISCAAWTRRIRWRCTRSAAICRARRTLTHDRNDAIFGLRKAVAGDDTALYNGLLLTLRDAAKVPGRKVVIVFSNGPDNASMVAPDDVRAVAEDEGIPIYVISTNDVNKDPISSSVFRRIAHTHRRQGVLGEDVAEAGGGVRSHPRGSGQFVYGDVLSGAESERRIPQDRYPDCQRYREAIPGAVAAGYAGHRTGRTMQVRCAYKFHRVFTAQTSVTSRPRSGLHPPSRFC